MDGQPKGGRRARTRIATAAVCSVLIAAGGVLAGTPASATGCTGSAPVGGLMQTLSGATQGLIDCVAGGGSTSSPSPSASPTTATTTTTDPTTAATSTTAAATTTTVADATTTDADGTVSTASTDAGSSTISAASASSTRLAGLMLARSSNTVYPVKDGYEDSVRFAVRAMNAIGSRVSVVGSADLTRAGKTVRTWHVDSDHSIITWDGRVGDAVRTGLYRLTVTAWSPDGSKLAATSLVRVKAKHLVKQAMVVRSNVGARSVSASLPKQLLKAYATGEVTCVVRTDADVTGPAKLVFRQGGVVRSVALKDGVHTTKPLLVPQGFDHVTITHAWKRGDATLHSLKAIWTYYTLR